MVINNDEYSMSHPLKDFRSSVLIPPWLKLVSPCSYCFTVLHCKIVMSLDQGVLLLQAFVMEHLTLCLHETGFVWNWYEIGMGKPCFYTGPGRSAPNRFSYPVSNGFTVESYPVGNYAVPGWYRALVNPTQFSLTRATSIRSKWN